MKMLFLTAVLVLNFQPAKPVPVKEEAPVEIQIMKPDFIRLYLQRVRLKENTPKQNLLDLLTISIALKEFELSPHDIGTTEAELIVLARKAMIASTKEEIELLRGSDLNSLDRKILAGEVSDAVEINVLSADELNISEEDREALLLRK